MKFAGTAWNRFVTNAGFVVFFVLFILAAYANESTGTQLQQVCKLISLPPVIHLHRKNDQEQAETICAQRLKVSGKTYAD